MNIRQITIGRDRQCDIYLGSQCQFASHRHSTIYIDGNQLMYRDHSTNGTMINNVMVHNRTVPITHGDSIMVACRYPIAWSLIDNFFPPIPESTISFSQAQRMADVSPRSETYDEPQTPDLSAWNWGAFSLYPIWGFWNGCWWGILVAFLLSCLSPIPNIIFGIYGTRWAWENKHWNSVHEFESMQQAWKPWGIAFFILDILALVWWIPFCIGLIML